MRSRSMLMLSFYVAASLACATPANAGLFGRRHHDAAPTAGNARANDYVLSAINAERKRGHVVTLTLDDRVSRVAQAYAFDMARRNFFSHISPEGVDPFTRMHRVGLIFHAAGENIGEADDLAKAERAIYGSPEHRAIVLGPRFRHVGIGSLQTRGGVLLVEDFTD